MVVQRQPCPVPCVDQISVLVVIHHIVEAKINVTLAVIDEHVQLHVRDLIPHILIHFQYFLAIFLGKLQGLGSDDGAPEQHLGSQAENVRSGRGVISGIAVNGRIVIYAIVGSAGGRISAGEQIQKAG